MKSLHKVILNLMVCTAVSCANTLSNEKKNTIATVNAPSGLHLRDAPSRFAQSNMLLKNGEDVEVVSNGNVFDTIDNIRSKWSYCRYKDKRGWLFMGYLTMSKSSTITGLISPSSKTNANSEKDTFADAPSFSLVTLDRDENGMPIMAQPTAQPLYSRTDRSSALLLMVQPLQICTAVGYGSNNPLEVEKDWIQVKVSGYTGFIAREALVNVGDRLPDITAQAHLHC